MFKTRQGGLIVARVVLDVLMANSTARIWSRCDWERWYSLEYGIAILLRFTPQYYNPVIIEVMLQKDFK